MNMNQRVTDAAVAIESVHGIPAALVTQIIWADIRMERREYGVISDQQLERILNDCKQRYGVTNESGK